MSLTPKPIIFFDESTIIADRWSLEHIAEAARRLLPICPGQHIFVKLERFMDSHLFFLVILAATPDTPLRIWRATIIDEDTDPEFECLSIKE